MAQFLMPGMLLVSALLIQAQAATPSKKAVALVGHATNQKVSPPIRSGTDKEFFGPPFPANYPEDKRPTPDKSILDKLKGPDQPYPALQSKADFDKDFVKDENSDRGAWKAQFEYDSLRRKLANEAGDIKGAEDRAGKEGRDVDAAQRNADKAGKAVDDAEKALDNARNSGGSGGDADKDEDFSGPPSAEKLEKLKKAVKEAEEKLEKERKDFAECERQLEAAKKNLEELKAKQVEMEQQLAEETKLWLEKKTVKLNLQKAAEKARKDAAAAKLLAAHERLKAASAVKSDLDKVLAEKKAIHEKSQKIWDQKKAELAKSRKDMERATLTLQKLRGYKPDVPEPKKSGTSAARAFMFLPVLLAMCGF